MLWPQCRWKAGNALMAHPHRLGALCVDIEEFFLGRRMFGAEQSTTEPAMMSVSRLHGTRASACLTGFGLAISLPSMLRFMETHIEFVWMWHQIFEAPAFDFRIILDERTDKLGIHLRCTVVLCL